MALTSSTRTSLPMNRSHVIFLLLTGLILLLNACTKPDQPDDSGYIRFIVGADNTEDTKGLFIENDANLRDACTPTDQGHQEYRGKAIGVWAEMFDGTKSYTNYFPELGDNPRRSVKLLYDPSDASHVGETSTSHDERGNHWVTERPISWSVGQTYYFRAFYPAELEARTSSTGKVFVLEYQPEIVQEDLMVAYWNTGELNETTVYQHVPLRFRHTLSAFRFNFQFSYDHSDKLTALWLENSGPNQFVNHAYLAYGDGMNTDNAIAPDYNASAAEMISWFDTDAPAAGMRFYEWSDSEGILFDGSHPATAYTGSSTTTGSAFTHNDGWVFVIPQIWTAGTAISPKTRICFQTESGGNSVFQLQLPTPETLLPKTNPSDPDVHAFVKGQRYDFTIKIGKTNLEAVITILPWEKYDAYYHFEY